MGHNPGTEGQLTISVYPGKLNPGGMFLKEYVWGVTSVQHYPTVVFESFSRWFDPLFTHN